jgi:PII-like signaling protein
MNRCGEKGKTLSSKIVNVTTVAPVVPHIVRNENMLQKSRLQLKKCNTVLLGISLTPNVLKMLTFAYVSAAIPKSLRVVPRRLKALST